MEDGLAMLVLFYCVRTLIYKYLLCFSRVLCDLSSCLMSVFIVIFGYRVGYEVFGTDLD